MSIERTLSIIKPDAVGKNVIGKIISRFEDNNLYLVAGKLIHLSDEMASGLIIERVRSIAILLSLKFKSLLY